MELDGKFRMPTNKINMCAIKMQQNLWLQTCTMHVQHTHIHCSFIFAMYRKSQQRNERRPTQAQLITNAKHFLLTYTSYFNVFSLIAFIWCIIFLLSSNFAFHAIIIVSFPSILSIRQQRPYSSLMPSVKRSQH